MLAETEAVKCWFPVRGHRGFGAHPVIRAVDGVSLAVAEGATIGIIGESGSGKTTLARLLLGIYKPTAGKVLFEGKDLTTLSSDDARAYRRQVQAVFQDPRGAFDPRMKMASAVAEPLRAQGASKSEANRRAAEAVQFVGLGKDMLQQYPHECSGGMLQRIAIARAISASPKLIVLDEPVSSLDVSIRGQVINLLMDLRTRLGLSYVLISHELVTTRHLSDNIYVMYAGRVVEHGEGMEVYDEPLHPYTKLLVAAAGHDRPLDPGDVIDEGPPDSSHLPTGCRFHPRCPVAMRGCITHEPMLTASGKREVACHLYTDVLSSDERTLLRPPVRAVRAVSGSAQAPSDVLGTTATTTQTVENVERAVEK
jgi:oligopeptide transport system ATP-binding protein